MSFSLGWAHLLLAFLAALSLRAVARDSGRHWLRFFAAAALGLCVLMLPGSAWLWDRIALLQYVEFPWRLLGPVALCVAMAIAPLGVSLSPATAGARLAFLAATGLLVIANVGHARPERYSEIDLHAWGPEEIARRGVAVTTRDEYASRWMPARLPFRPERIRVIDGAAEIEGFSRTPSRWRAQIRASRDSILELSLSFYPGWRAWLSGKEAPLEPEAQTGLIRLRVPAGEQQLEVRFTRTRWRVAADGLSLLSAIALGLLFYRGHAVPAAGSPAR